MSFNTLIADVTVIFPFIDKLQFFKNTKVAIKFEHLFQLHQLMIFNMGKTTKNSINTD